MIAYKKSAFSLTRAKGLFVGFVLRGRGKSLGFTVKTGNQLSFSERHGYKSKGVKIGPLFFSGLK